MAEAPKDLTSQLELTNKRLEGALFTNRRQAKEINNLASLARDLASYLDGALSGSLSGQQVELARAYIQALTTKELREPMNSPQSGDFSGSNRRRKEP